MKRYDQGSIGMREDANGAWCDYEKARAEIELLRTSERSAWNAAVQRDEEIKALRLEVLFRDTEVRAKADEIARLREMNANLQTAFDGANEETQRFGELLRAENRRIVEREKEIERLRWLLREALTGETHGDWMMRIREAIGD